MGITSIRRITKTLLPGVIVILVVAMAVGGIFLNPSSPTVPDFKYRGASVRVNGIKLKDTDYQKLITQISNQANQQRMYGLVVTEEQIREEALQQSIRDLVVQSEAKKSKVRVSSADIDRFFNRWAKQFPTKDERYNFYQMYNIASDREFKAEIKKYLAEQRLYLELAKKKQIDVKVTAAEVRDAYASVDVSHILIGTQKDDKGVLLKGNFTEVDAKKRADEVYAKLKAGEDWDKLAKEYSTDTNNKDKGGSLGESQLVNFKTQYDKDFVAGALKLKDGEYSEPVKSSFGYHIIKMNARKDADGAEFRKQSEEIKAQLIYNKFRASEQYGKYVEARIADADVVILDPALRAYELKTKDKWADAAKFYEKAVNMRRHKWDRDIALSALEVFAHEKQWDKAVKYSRRILKLYKEDMDLNATLGKALYQRGKGKDKKEAVTFLNKAKDLAGDDTTALTKMKQVYTDLKLTKDAKALDAKIRKLIEAQIKEQERVQKQMEEERKKQEAAQAQQGSGTTTPSTSTTPDTQSGTGGQ